MPLVAGSVTVDPDTGERTGSGYALALYDADTTVTAQDPETPGPNWDADEWKALIIASRTAAAAKYTAQAVATVALVAGSDVRIASGAIDSGVPSVERVLAGAVE